MEKITLEELGNRIKLIRHNLLKFSQAELAEILETQQVLISRLEKGKGSVTLFLDFLNYLNSKGYRGYLLFASSFSLQQINASIPISVEQIVQLLKLHLEDSEKSIQEVLSRLDLLL